MIKKVIYTILCFSVVTSMMGCSKEKEKKVYDENKTKWENEKLDENVEADFQAELVETGYIYNAKYKALEAQKIKDIFFESDTSEVKVEKYLYSEEYEEFGYIEYLYTSKGTSITTAFDGVHAYTEEYPYYMGFVNSNIYDNLYDEKAKRDNLGTEEELAFLSKSDVEKEIQDKISQLGIDYEIGKIHIRTLSDEYLNQIQNEIIEKEAGVSDDEKTYDPNLISEWTNEDSAYYVVVEIEKDGIPWNGTVMTEFSNGTMASNYRMVCIVNKDGFQYVDFPYIEIVDKSECDLISADQAVQALKDDITSVIVTEEYLIDNAELCSTVMIEMGVTEVTVNPVWMFDVSSKDDNNDSYTEYYLVDAVTGEVLH